MKRCILFLLLLLLGQAARGQAYENVIDKEHIAAFAENASFRAVADETVISRTSSIGKMQRKVNVNMLAVTTVQTVIKNSLTEINGVLKNGLQIKQISVLTGEILKYQQQMKNVALGQPAMLLVVRASLSELTKRAGSLVMDITSFVAKGGDKNMMNYNSRDELLGHIVMELKIMRGLSYGMYRSMYWAKRNGVLKTINPYQRFINQDRLKAQEITRNLRRLKK